MQLERLIAALAPTDVVGGTGVEIRDLAYDARKVAAEVTQVVVSSVRAAMPVAAVEFFGDPTAQLPVAGITGTNGKTTTAYLLWSILDAAGERPGLLTNVERRVGSEIRDVGLNTPEAV